MAPQPDDLDALIGALNSEADRRGSSARDEELHGWIRHVVEHHGSDLLLVTGSPPVMRLDGSLQAIGTVALDDQDVEDAIVPLLPAHAAK